jgi:hypothetical protein
LKALSKYTATDPEIYRSILNIFLKCADTNSEVFTILVDSVRASFPRLVGSDSILLARLIRAILSRPDQTWVQNASVLSLLTTIGLEAGSQLIDGFEAMMLENAVSFSFDPHDDLAFSALKCLSTCANMENIHWVTKSLWKCDVIDELCGVRFLSVLHTIIDCLGVERVKQFGGVVVDLILFSENDWQVAGDGFRFLNQISYDPPPIVQKTCLDWIVRMYRSITHYDSLVSSPFHNEPLPPLISIVDTDVIALDVKDRMLPLLHSYQYFASFNKNANSVTAELTRELLALFPEAVIPKSRRFFDEKSQEFQAYCRSVASILKTESSPAVSALCCDFLPAEFREGMFGVVDWLFKDPRIVGPRCLASFFNCLVAMEPLEREEYLEIVKSRVDPAGWELFKIVIGEGDIGMIPFSRLPIDLDSFGQKIRIDDFDAIDDQHFRFFLGNQDKFEAPGFDDYRRTHPARMKRFEYSPNQPVPDLDLKTANVSKGCSALPQLLRGSIDVDEALVYSFLRCSSYVIKTKLLGQLFQKIEKPRTAIAGLDYAKRAGILVSEEILLKFSELNDHELNRMICEALTVRPELLERIRCSDKEIFRMALAPDAYLKEYVQDFHPKSRNLLKLSKLISTGSFDAETLSQCVKHLLDNLAEVRSPKRLMALLRVVNQTLSSRNRKLPTSFLDFLNEKLALLRGTDVGSVYPELALILARFWTFYKPDLLTICELFDRTAPSVSLFIVAQAVAVAAHSANCSRLVEFSDLFSCQIPSQKLGLLTALQTLVGSPRHFPLFRNALRDFVRTFSDAAAMPLFDFSLSSFVTSVVGSATPELQSAFVQKVAPLIFQPPHSPQFVQLSMAVSAISHSIRFLIPGYQNFVNSALLTVPIPPSAASLVRDYAEWWLQIATDAREVVQQQLAALQKLFCMSPTLPNGMALVKAVRAPSACIDHAAVLLGRLALMAVPLLSMLVLVQGYVVQCSEEELGNCWAAYEAAVESYPSKELADGIRLILERKPNALLEFVDRLITGAS